MPTIARSHTRRVAEVRERAVRCRVYSSANDFNGRDCSPENAWAEWDRKQSARLAEHDDGHWSVTIDANHWYELYPAEQGPPPGEPHPQGRSGIDPDVLEQVLAEQIGSDATETVFAELDTATTLAGLDDALDCRCAERDEPAQPDVMVCGTCGRGWCRRCHPTPSGRCPFEYDHAAAPERKPGRLRWEATGRYGQIDVSDEGTVTLLLDGEPFLGVDLGTGRVVTWPDGETAHEIATFAARTPAPHLSLVADGADIIELRDHTARPQ